MSLFCFLLAPLVAWFRQPFSHGSESRRGIFIAFVSGAVSVLIGSVAMPFIPTGLFDMTRWVRFLLIVGLPPLLPLVLRAVVERFSLARMGIDAETFALVFLMPFGAARALSISESYDLSSLVLIPALWSMLAVVIPAFLRNARDEIGILFVLSVASAVLLPPIAATSAWAFFAHHPLAGTAAFAAVLAPATIVLARIHLAALARNGKDDPAPGKV